MTEIPKIKSPIPKVQRKDSLRLVLQKFPLNNLTAVNGERNI